MNKKTNPKPALRSSRQRERLLALLQETEIHPTADWLYARLKPEFPHLSLGTVYRNLTILTEQGLVKKIHSGSTFDRFEARVMPHYHLICRRCDTIQDLEMPILKEINERAGRITNFQIQEHQIDFYGLCSSCRRQKPVR
ncbi:MAG TPA: transcriptional repressor [bacterium]|nr:transcriptional repressor [bacterium]HQG44764.1 transcriptional repressor [bacterium]HQI47527.1 transcriptional repressor [bacterium]HQJ63104.1 transcriptional repressor [bacterium]